MIAGRRILVISPYTHRPLSQGSIVRTHQVVRFLAEENVVWFAHRNSGNLNLPDPSRHISGPSGPHAQLFNLGYLWRLQRLVGHEDLDLIIASHFWSAIHGLLLKWLTRRHLVIDTHNVEYQRLRTLGKIYWPIVLFFELLSYHGADWVWCVSPHEKAHLEQRLKVPAHKIQVVPNGVDLARVRNHNSDPGHVVESLDACDNEKLLLYFGTLSYEPNAQAVDVILDELVPRLKNMASGWRIVIAGSDHDRYLSRRETAPPPCVTFTGYVEDILSMVKCAHMVIVPLTTGGGTRLKILESVAARRRVISTSVGAEGLDRRVFGDALVVRDDWNEFAAQIVTGLQQPREVNFPPAFAATYDWRTILGQARAGQDTPGAA